MHALARRTVLVAVSAALGFVLTGTIPAEAKKGGGFKVFFQASLPGEPKGGKKFKFKKGPVMSPTAIYNDAVGSVTLAGTVVKPGLTVVTTAFTVNVFANMDLTDVTFPVSRPCLLTLSYSKTKALGGGTPYSLNYSTADSGVTLTVDSFDPATGNMTGSLTGSVEFHENAQDPKDDARDGTVIALSNAKFSLTKPDFMKR